MKVTADNPYTIGLERDPANFIALSPLTFLERAASIWPERTAVVHGAIRRDWAETYRRCRRLAGALRGRGIGKGDTVAMIAANTPELFEAHFGVPLCGAVLNTINTRLDADTIAFILNHGDAKLLITDREFSLTVRKALARLGRVIHVIDIDDPQFGDGDLLGEKNYEALLQEGTHTGFSLAMPEDEWQAISLNYTSGTTGNPKGVVYHHRGAYLNAVSNALAWHLNENTTYLWTLPMFHCNGWCFPWTMALVGGTSVFLRHTRAERILDAILSESVTHFCAASAVLNMINNAAPELKAGMSHVVKVMTGGAPPPASVIAGMERMGWDVTHVYGLTESYGPAVQCVWRASWNDLALDARAQLKARQGVRGPALEAMMVAHPDTLEPVPKDGQTLGEVFLRGNNVMKGYLRNPDATTEAFAGGWFHSGDLGVWHPDGYLEIKDRSKDIIISGGENISSIEIEDVLYSHPAVLEAAIVARPDDKWGETPCAFITLKDSALVTEADIIAFCRERMAHFKTPRTIVFTPLPKTATGKIQKFILRERARQL
ncbi:fatty-acyl-CoA synthase [Paraburkholderia sp. BL18I3N2]|uniref:acyl-CoA synthetase n=1 Tax=Paraburkholderia sp. BL18I3N2 TaxID=1938799 RepID=UPI000D06BB31|nr:acyl-CoA synthetase [Paraburkholderia sp. BL18I3N2]PRX20086.1 fatty-acyl-CoA synthase [Paraburkholderia sp. BL18I3N2]